MCADTGLHTMTERIFGVETEFGCYVDPAFGRPEEAVSVIKNHVFQKMKMGVIDRHARDEVFEPAESGGFLINGGRLYIDAVGSHLEYATAECRKLKDVVAQDRAGQRIIARAIKELGLDEVVDVYANSVDHFGGHTFGCHENYLVPMDEDFFTRQVVKILGFLVTRQIFAGVGRVGGHILAETELDYQKMAENPIDYIWVSNVYGVYADPSVTYQLSQRADHILRTVASRVRFNRAMINPKWEHFYSSEGSHRLHLLFGESNPSDYAYALKIGTTHLVLRLLEDGLLDAVPRLASPLLALRSISRDPRYEWKFILEDGDEENAIAYQRRLRDLAERYRGETADTDWTLNEWTRTLDDLASDPMRCADRIDWVAKKVMLTQYIAEAGTDWNDDALHSLDLEYHNIKAERSLAAPLITCPFLDPLDPVEAETAAPSDTRAHGRAKLVQRIVTTGRPAVYMFDWSGVALGRHDYIDLGDPFNSYEDV